MADAGLPPTDLVLQALHAIRNELVGTRKDLSERLDQMSARIDQTNQRLDQTNQRLDQTNERLDSLRIFTVQKLTDLNAKVDHLGSRVDQLGDRLENVLTGQLGQDVRDLKARMQAVEERLESNRASESPPDYGTKPTGEG